MDCKLTVLSDSISLASLTNVQVQVPVELLVVTSVIRSSKTDTH